MYLGEFLQVSPLLSEIESYKHGGTVVWQKKFKHLSDSKGYIWK